MLVLVYSPEFKGLLLKVPYVCFNKGVASASIDTPSGGVVDSHLMSKA